MLAGYRPMEDIDAVGYGQKIRKRANIYGYRRDWKKQTAEEDHWKTKEIREGLCFEDLAYRDCDEEPEEG